MKEKGEQKNELINLTKIYLKNQARNKRLKTTYIFSWYETISEINEGKFKGSEHLKFSKRMWITTIAIFRYGE